MIVKVEFNEPNVSIEDIFPGDLAEAQLLEREKGKQKGKESETYTYFIKVRRLGPDLLAAAGGCVSLPC